jgi:hypothetical protein
LNQKLCLIIAIMFLLLSCGKSQPKKTVNSKPENGHVKPLSKVVSKPVSPDASKLKSVSYGDSLIKLAGTDVAVVATKTGLKALGADGKFSKVLVAGEVVWCSADNKVQGVWFLKKEKGKLNGYFYDLFRLQPPIRLLSNYPQNSLDSYPIYVEYDKKMITTGAYNMEAALVISYLKDKLSLTVTYGPLTEIFEERKAKYKKFFSHLKIENRKTFQEIFKRSKNRNLKGKGVKGPLKKLQVDPAGCDGNADICGSLRILPGTSLYVVMVEHSCGDACYFNMVLYDAKTKKYVDPDDPTKSYADFKKIKTIFVWGVTSPRGKGMIINNRLVHYVKGVIKTGLGYGGGWIGGGWRY